MLKVQDPHQSLQKEQVNWQDSSQSFSVLVVKTDKLFHRHFQLIVDEFSRESESGVEPVKTDPAAEKELLKCLSEVSLTLPSSSEQLASMVGRPLLTITNLLQKFATQQLIRYMDQRSHV